MKTALVFGGTGQIGTAAASALADAGWRVLAATRSGRPLPGDVSALGIIPIDAREKPVAAVLDEIGTTIDALVHPMVFDDKDAAALLAASGRYGALAVISTISVYADRAGRSLETADESGSPEFGGAVGEDGPTVKPGPDSYSSRKVAMEQALQAAAIPVTILRPGAIHGRYGRHPREWWFLKRALDGRKAIPSCLRGGQRLPDDERGEHRAAGRDLSQGPEEHHAQRRGPARALGAGDSRGNCGGVRPQRADRTVSRPAGRACRQHSVVRADAVRRRLQPRAGAGLGARRLRRRRG